MGVEQYVQLGLAGIALALMYKIVNRAMDNNQALARSIETSNAKLSESIDKNTAVTNELYDYVRVRNGTLERLVEQEPRVRLAARRALGGRP